MFTIRATANTFLKREPISASQLSDAYKRFSRKGTEWNVDSHSTAADDHLKIELAYGAGTWYAYRPHWSGFPTVAAPSPSPDLLTIQATQDTYLKREVTSSSALPTAYKKLSKKGTEWQVEKFTTAANDHIQIELAYGSGTWFVYRPHWGGFPNSNPPTPEPNMITIRATQDTYLKREIKPSSALSDAYKKLNKKGTEWQVEKFTEEAADHIKVELAYGSGTWYVYKLHWDGFPGAAAVTEPVDLGSATSSSNIDSVPVCGMDLIKKFEGIELHAYPDPLTGGDPWTIGYGSTFYESGVKVKKGDTITKEQAEKELINNCKKSFMPHLEKIPHFNEMDDYQKGALLSFAYNLGARFYGATNFETITRTLKNKDWGYMRKALVLYRNPGSNVEAGLLRRRNAEADVWFTNVKEDK
ncbi:lysozyme [[Limnothrix rosea] IAM M-220]|uniref:lysozyme n=1 Tax=[Limnothrix rosea] IAM M-220 TaxID=454133 RepID=UPI000961061E|nr:lysozyme [[Limnothrix rosea] IAM M-220]OKH19523.1 hypothetical protein NIES208_01575 [[Limnothrix rosea] IAM M-220]